jgi:hypothetical protein
MNAKAPWSAVAADREVVLWEGPEGACHGTTASSAGLFGIKIDFGEITQWWQKAKEGFELM